MTDGNNRSTKTKPIVSPYDEAMDALSSLITKRTRADKSNSGDRFDFLFDYIKMLELDEPISQMKVIHVAGTKGKGSTCTFTEAILRNCGFHTGLFTSPHLIDVRERFRLDGVDICEEKFLAYFWWCFDRLKEKTNDDIPMPTYFRFLALLAFKIFAAEQVDVAILEVGLGGKFDATNVVQSPIVCGISSLGYDHMEILVITMRLLARQLLTDTYALDLRVEYSSQLRMRAQLEFAWNTLGAIAGEKAGIFKKGVPAFTVPQPDEAMHVLEETARVLDVPLKVATPLDPNLLNGLHLGLHGDHQYLNAGLAIALCSTWLQRTGHVEFNYLEQSSSLSEQFIEGLTTATLQGRAQVVPDQFIDIEKHGDLVFYLDGAHSPESMEVCAKWFTLAIKEDKEYQKSLNNQAPDSSRVSEEVLHVSHSEASIKDSTQILLFNCMSVRDPQLLLPRLINTCASHGVNFKQALFVPNASVYNKVGTSTLQPTDSQVDVSWQLTLQRLYEYIIRGEKGDSQNAEVTSDEGKDDTERLIRRCENSTVFPSLPLAIKWLRETVLHNKSVRYQVLVTGSLHLVGDVLKLVKK